MRRTLILPLCGLTFMLCACSHKSFNKNLLSERENQIAPVDQRGAIKYYDATDGKKHFYLLTVYKTFEKLPGEDFSFEGVNTYKKNREADPSVVSASGFKVVQYLALYFFKNGGIIYHVAYKNKDSTYRPLNITNFQDFYAIPKPHKKYGAMMHGYISKAINPNIINETAVSRNNKTRIDSTFGTKERQFSQIATGKASTEVTEDTTYRKMVIKPRVLRLYLEREAQTDKKKLPKSMYLLIKHLPSTNRYREAVIIEQIYYQKEVNSTDAIYTQALIEKVFNFGTVEDEESNATLWFRLQPEP